MRWTFTCGTSRLLVHLCSRLRTRSVLSLDVAASANVIRDVCLSFFSGAPGFRGVFGAGGAGATLTVAVAEARGLCGDAPAGSGPGDTVTTSPYTSSWLRTGGPGGTAGLAGFGMIEGFSGFTVSRFTA